MVEVTGEGKAAEEGSGRQDEGDESDHIAVCV